MKEKKIIFLTGMPRAMTTLMANILANNPNIGGGETSPMLEYLYGARINYSEVPETKSSLTRDAMLKSLHAFCAQGMQGYANCITSKKIYLDKSRGHIQFAPFIREFYPNMKVICMVRDIRACVSSMEKKWRENPSVKDVRENLQQQTFITLDTRVNAFLNDAPLGLALRRLYDAIQTKQIKNFHVVKAEDLCSSPELTMQNVYDYIEEPYYKLDYNKIKQVTVENDRIADYGIYGDHKIREKIQPAIKDYKEVLGNALSNNIKVNHAWFYDHFGY